MNEYDRIPISMIKQYIYCKRRFALMHIDDLWAKNYKIVEGDILHENVDDPFFNEKRKGKYFSRSIPVFSNQYNLYGIVDVIEFNHNDGGVKIETKPGLWSITPIEYKNGKPEKSNADYFQLCAQVLCLEEMFKTKIHSGDIFYGKLRRRVNVLLTKEIKEETIETISKIHEMIRKPCIPPKPENQNCNLCSLIDICVPAIFDKKQSNYKRIKMLLKRGEQ